MKVGLGNGDHRRKNTLTETKIYSYICCMPSAWIPKRKLFSTE